MGDDDYDDDDDDDDDDDAAAAAADDDDDEEEEEEEEEVSKARRSARPNKLRSSSSKSWLQSGRLRRGSLSWRCRFRTKPRQKVTGFGGPSGSPLATRDLIWY